MGRVSEREQFESTYTEPGSTCNNLIRIMVYLGFLVKEIPFLLNKSTKMGENFIDRFLSWSD